MASGQRYTKIATIHAVAQEADFAVASLEGLVHGKAGDYLATGIDGEQWPISRETFTHGYVAVEGQPHVYRKTGFVLAQPMPDAFTVPTPHGVLHGKAGDYLVTGESGSQWIVDKTIFERTHTPAKPA